MEKERASAKVLRQDVSLRMGRGEAAAEIGDIAGQR